MPTRPPPNLLSCIPVVLTESWFHSGQQTPTVRSHSSWLPNVSTNNILSTHNFKTRTQRTDRFGKWHLYLRCVAAENPSTVNTNNYRAWSRAQQIPNNRCSQQDTETPKLRMFKLRSGPTLTGGGARRKSFSRFYTHNPQNSKLLTKERQTSSRHTCVTFFTDLSSEQSPRPSLATHSLHPGTVLCVHRWCLHCKGALRILLLWNTLVLLKSGVYSVFWKKHSLGGPFCIYIEKNNILKTLWVFS